jgi:hypothetical protein
MRFSEVGNDKVGHDTITVSRPTVDSCPPDCFFLNNGCYAQRTENRWKHTRSFAAPNLKTKKVGIIALIWKAISDNKPIRIHERGDFYIDNKLDIEYINNWKAALSEFDRDVLCNIWTYTHVYDKEVADLQNYGINIYASVNTEKQAKLAKKNGFKLFAWSTDLVKSKHKSNLDKPKYVDLPVIGSTLVCPEQRVGKSLTCSKCQWCIQGKGNVAFMKI